MVSRGAVGRRLTLFGSAARRGTSGSWRRVGHPPAGADPGVKAVFDTISLVCAVMGVVVLPG
jgi:hypothetical protein